MYKAKLIPMTVEEIKNELGFDIMEFYQKRSISSRKEHSSSESLNKVTPSTLSASLLSHL